MSALLLRAHLESFQLRRRRPWWLRLQAALSQLWSAPWRGGKAGW